MSRKCLVNTPYVTITQAELERQREDEKRKMEERSDQLNANQKEALLEKFKLDQVSSCFVSSIAGFWYDH